MIRQQFRELPQPPGAIAQACRPPKPAEGTYDVLPADHRLPYDMEEVHRRVFSTADTCSSFSPSMRRRCCAPTRASNGRPVGVDRQSARVPEDDGRPAHRRHRLYRIGAEGGVFRRKRRAHRTPLIYLQDVSGFMVGPEAESEGIIRAGAEMVETMACATVPKIVLTVNHASGAGYYAMAGQGFDPNFTFGWPTRPHRRHGRRFRRAGAVFGRTRKATKPRRAAAGGAASSDRQNARRLRALAGCQICRRARPRGRHHRSRWTRATFSRSRSRACATCGTRARAPSNRLGSS